MRRQHLRHATNRREAALNLRGEQRVAIYDGVLHAGDEAVIAVRQRPGHVEHPGAIGVGGDADELDFASHEADRVERMMPSRSTSGIRHLEGGEVDRREIRPVGEQEPLPVVGRPSLWRGRDAVATQDVADRAVGNHEAECDHSIADRILAPPGIVTRHRDDERLGLSGDPRPTVSVRPRELEPTIGLS